MVTGETMQASVESLVRSSAPEARQQLAGQLQWLNRDELLQVSYDLIEHEGERSQSLGHLSMLVDAAERVTRSSDGLVQSVIARDWLPNALALVDLYRAKVPPAWGRLRPTLTTDPRDMSQRGRGLLAYTNAIAAWLRSIGTVDENQLRGHAMQGIAAAAAMVCDVDHGHLIAGACGAPGHVYPISLLERDLVANVREAAHYGRIALHGYPVEITEHCWYCENDFGVVFRGGFAYLCRACDEFLAECRRCDNFVEKPDLAGPLSDLCASCADGEDDHE
jgi:hypothetical protein